MNLSNHIIAVNYLVFENSLESETVKDKYVIDNF